MPRIMAPSKFRVSRSGFTLVEVIVVIAVVGILGSVVLNLLTPSLERSRDSRRLQDVEQLRAALEIYYKNHGHYPISNSCNTAGQPKPNTGWCNTAQTMSTQGHWIRHNDTDNALAGIIADPLDPLKLTPTAAELWEDSGIIVDPAPGTYYYFSDAVSANDTAGQWYMIVFTLESDGHTVHEHDGVRSCDPTIEYDYGNSYGNDRVITLGKSCN